MRKYEKAGRWTCIRPKTAEEQENIVDELERMGVKETEMSVSDHYLYHDVCINNPEARKILRTALKKRPIKLRSWR